MKLAFALAALPLVSLPAAAAPSELVCTLAGHGFIQIDGLIDDWSGVPALTRADNDPRDAAIAVRCAYDAEKLYLSVDVTDDRLIRTKQKTKDEDHLVFLLGGRTFEVYPALGDQGVKLASGWIGKAGGKVAVADSLQKQGWSVELAFAMRDVAKKGAPGVGVSVEFHDADSFTARHIETVVSTGEVLLVFEEAAAGLKSFLSDLHLSRSDVTLDAVAELDGAPGTDRIVVAGKYIGLVGQGYSYLELPVANARDVLGVELADLAGTGRKALVVRTVERGNGGSREVLSIWGARGGQWARIFAHEIAKQLGKNRLTNSWQLVARARGKRGLDLLIKPGEVVGFTRDTWNEMPASDMVPILLPWAEKKEELWHFDDDVVSGG